MAASARAVDPRGHSRPSLRARVSTTPSYLSRTRDRRRGRGSNPAFRRGAPAPSTPSRPQQMAPFGFVTGKEPIGAPSLCTLAISSGGASGCAERARPLAPAWAVHRGVSGLPAEAQQAPPVALVPPAVLRFTSPADEGTCRLSAIARHGRSRLCQSYVQEYEGFCETTGEPGRPLGYLFLESRFSSRRRQRHRSMRVHFRVPGWRR